MASTGHTVSLLVCLHDQRQKQKDQSFFQPIRAIWKLFRLLWLAG